MTVEHKYEYAGFRYVIGEVAPGEWRAVPEPDQHPAASKEKHRRAALDEWRAREGLR